MPAHPSIALANATVHADGATSYLSSSPRVSHGLQQGACRQDARYARIGAHQWLTSYLSSPPLGGKLTYLYVNKRAGVAKCGDCGVKLNGIPALRPRQYSQLSKGRKTVTRSYGGSRCACCVRNRIVRAFLVEEQKIVKKVLKSKGTAAAKEEPAAKAAAPAKTEKAVSSKKAIKK